MALYKRTWRSNKRNIFSMKSSRRAAAIPLQYSGGTLRQMPYSVKRKFKVYFEEDFAAGTAGLASTFNYDGVLYGGTGVNSIHL